MNDMNVSRETAQVIDAAKSLGFEINESVAAQLLNYAGMIQKWNKTYNITSIKDFETILSNHIFDSMAVYPPIRNIIEADGRQSLNVLDVGSGGGLPGVVLAILDTRIHVACLDAVQKKTSFITMAAGTLGLRNLKGVHSRIESYQDHKYDVVISRAFASLKDFADWSGHCLDQDGALLAMKGLDPHEEISELETQTSWKVNRIEKLAVPQLNAQRCLLWIGKK